MTEYFVRFNGSDYIIHHGIKGQRWGFRRYQNKDGSLTEAGKKRYEKRTARREMAKELRFLRGGKKETYLDYKEQKRAVRNKQRLGEISRKEARKEKVDLKEDLYDTRRKLRQKGEGADGENSQQSGKSKQPSKTAFERKGRIRCR